MIRIATAAVAIVLLGAAPATSVRQGFSTYREQNGRLTVMVDGYPASLHEGDAFIPVPIAVGLEGGGPSVALTTESFTLIGTNGRSYAAAAYDDLQAHYGKIAFDREVVRQRPIVTGQYFTTYERGESRFYPVPNLQTAISRVHLDRKTWIEDVLYFPKPSDGLRGSLTLRVETPELGGPTEVRFVVPALDPEEAQRAVE